MNKLNILDTVESIEALQVYLNDFEYVAYDCETTGVNKGSEIIGISLCAEEDKAFYIVLSWWDPINNKLEYSNSEVQYAVRKLVESLRNKKLIMHNGTFDCSMAESYFKVSLIESLHTDTMILAHLLNENRRVGLKELGKEYFGEDAADEQKEMKESVLKNGGKLTKSQYEMYKADKHLMGKYAAKDALLTYKLFLTLVPELYESKLEDFFYIDESMPLLKGPTYDLNTVGLKVDLPALTVLKKTLEAECLEAKAFIYQEIQPHIKDKYPGTNKKNTFNIGASQQLSWLLFGQLKLEFNTLTKGGKSVVKMLGIKNPYTRHAKQAFIQECEMSTLPKYRNPYKYIACDKKTLQKLAPKYKWIEKLLEYQKKTKLLNTYVEGIEERTQYGIIQPSFLMHGTTSGRYSSRNPNFQNLPRDDKRIKKCIVARPGKVFVGADFSQLEPRVFAYFSQDPRLIAAFDGSSDFYSVIGMEVYNKYDCTPQKDGSPDAFGVKYKHLRDQSKVIALASTYGATAHQLAPTTGKSIEDTQFDIDSYFETFPGVQKMMLNAHKTAKETGQVVNLFGRPRRMPEAKTISKLYGNLEHAELPYEARNILNLAVNHTIQSTGASICNRAMIAFHNNIKELGIDCKIVMQIHDEIIVETAEEWAEEVSIMLEHAMISSVILPGVSLEAIPKIAKTIGDLK